MSVYVLFLGGYQASQPDVDAWLRSARAVCGDDVIYDAFPYPAGASKDGASAVTTFKKAGDFDKAIKAIESSSADEKYIVGHSSGCAIANAVDRGLKDTTKISLVALDGYAPDHKQVARPSTQIWSAVGEDHGISLHYQDLNDSFPGRLQVYHAPDCSTLIALHFSLVNAAASDKIKLIRDGYSGCRANLIWLK